VNWTVAGLAHVIVAEGFGSETVPSMTSIGIATLPDADVEVGDGVGVGVGDAVFVGVGVGVGDAVFVGVGVGVGLVGVEVFVGAGVGAGVQLMLPPIAWANPGLSEIAIKMRIRPAQTVLVFSFIPSSPKRA
jgi:hypothetical protein